MTAFQALGASALLVPPSGSAVSAAVTSHARQSGLCPRSGKGRWHWESGSCRRAGQAAGPAHPWVGDPALPSTSARSWAWPLPTPGLSFSVRQAQSRAGEPRGPRGGASSPGAACGNPGAQRGSCTPPASPHAALLFKVAVVWLPLFLKTIPVLELSSTRPAVTTKNVCRVTATSEEVGGGRRPRMGPQSGWIKKKTKQRIRKPALQGRNKRWRVWGGCFSLFLHLWFAGPSGPCCRADGSSGRDDRGGAAPWQAHGPLWAALEPEPRLAAPPLVLPAVPAVPPTFIPLTRKPGGGCKPFKAAVPVGADAGRGGLSVG